MNQDPVGDDFFCDSNVVPCGPDKTMGPQLLVPSLVDASEQDGPNKTNPTELQALQAGEIFCGGSPAEEMHSVTDAPLGGDRASPPESEQGFPFLSMPYELRQHVYRWIHLASPVKQLRSRPWLPTPVYSAYFLNVVCPDLAIWAWVGACGHTAEEQVAGAAVHVGTGTKAPRLCPYRPLAGMPTSLLRANKQIFRETRELPFAENEFVFVSWFASGLWSARSFLQHLQPWQRDAMRYARLELLSQDASGYDYMADWKELCGSWSNGLRGLRLKLSAGGAAGGNPIGSWTAYGAAADDGPEALQGWLKSGLDCLRQLRCLEIELTFAEWANERRIKWCEDLEEALNESRAENTWISVISVERDVRRTVGNAVS